MIWVLITRFLTVPEWIKLTAVCKSATRIVRHLTSRQLVLKCLSMTEKTYQTFLRKNYLSTDKKDGKEDEERKASRVVKLLGKYILGFFERCILFFCFVSQTVLFWVGMLLFRRSTYVNPRKWLFARNSIWSLFL
jgi:hypothetical protein